MKSLKKRTTRRTSPSKKGSRSRKAIRSGRATRASKASRSRTVATKRVKRRVRARTSPTRHRAPKRPSVGPRLPADQVFPVLQRHLLLDGFEIVLDLQRSRGAYIVDAQDGKRYLDFFTFVSSNPLGLNHPKMTTREFREKLGYVAVNKPSLSDIYTAEQAEFVETFSRVAIPPYLPHAFFIEGGALANENALKAAFDWKIRKNFESGYREERGRQVLHFSRAFHGRTGYTMSMTNTEPVKTALYPKFNWPRVHAPVLRFPITEENLHQVQHEEETAINQIKDAFYQNRDDIAAIMIEPIQGEGGDNQFRPEFFAALRRLADENEAMLIMDEVQTGIAITGKMWAHQHYVKPDMVAFGKKMQVCGFLCGTRIDEVKENVFVVPSRLNSTWGGNLVDMVRAQRYLEIIEQDNLVEHARVVGEYLLSGLNQLAEDLPGIVSNQRGLGLFAAFDVANPDVRTEIRKKCLEKGLIILPSGERSIRFRPPLTVTRDEIDIGLRIIAESMHEL
ncbi:MAG: L-lysine 6-transaminase [Bacteroidetes bacterium]|nr:L-lysine 6-transaminase [Bacteroidota bacterium]